MTNTNWHERIAQIDNEIDELLTNARPENIADTAARMKELKDRKLRLENAINRQAMVNGMQAGHIEAHAINHGDGLDD